MNEEEKLEIVRKINDFRPERQTILVDYVPTIVPETIEMMDDPEPDTISAKEGGHLTQWFSDRSSFGRALSAMEDLGLFEEVTYQVYSYREASEEDLRFLKRLVVEYNLLDDDIDAGWDHAADKLGLIDLEK